MGFPKKNILAEIGEATNRCFFSGAISNKLSVDLSRFSQNLIFKKIDFSNFGRF